MRRVYDCFGKPYRCSSAAEFARAANHNASSSLRKIVKCCGCKQACYRGVPGIAYLRTSSVELSRCIIMRQCVELRRTENAIGIGVAGVKD